MIYNIKDDKFLLNNKEVGHYSTWDEPWYTFADCNNYVSLINDKYLELFYEMKESDYLENYHFSSRFEDRFPIDFWKKNGKAYVLADFSINGIDWEENISLKKFKDIFENSFSSDGKVSYSLEFFYENGELIVKAIMELGENQLVNGVAYLEKDFSEKRKSVLSINSLVKTINFSPEHLTAGSAILQYFGKLLQEKYPDAKVSVSIKQEGFKVTMIVETPDGKKEEVEEYLNNYGLVISNQILPQEFTSNPIQLLELETKLKSAELEIGFQKQLLALKDKTYDENLVSLKDEVKYLREELSVLRKSNDENIKAFLSSLLTKDKLIKKLTKAIENSNQEETKQLLLELKEKDSKGYMSLKEHIDNIIAGNLTNTPSWIELIITHFPK